VSTPPPREGAHTQLTGAADTLHPSPLPAAQQSQTRAAVRTLQRDKATSRASIHAFSLMPAAQQVLVVTPCCCIILSLDLHSPQCEINCARCFPGHESQTQNKISKITSSGHRLSYQQFQPPAGIWSLRCTSPRGTS
jgi:hypothetical protein